MLSTANILEPCGNNKNEVKGFVFTQKVLLHLYYLLFTGAAAHGFISTNQNVKLKE